MSNLLVLTGSHTFSRAGGYIRWSYRAYTLMSIDYENDVEAKEDDETPLVLMWRFKLGQSHLPPQHPKLGPLSECLPPSALLISHELV